MCLYTKTKKPRVAKRDIIVRKYLNKDSEGFCTPCQNARVKLDETLVPNRSKPQIDEFGKDNFNKVYYEINGGVIHAKTLPSRSYGSYCKQAIIPKGTKYWIHSFGLEVAAEKLFITSKDGDNCNLEALWREILEDAPDTGYGLKIGDIILEDGTSVSPFDYKDGGIAIVCGSHEGKPLVCALEFIKSTWSKCYNTTGKILSREDAIKAFNGRTLTKNYKENNTCNIEAFDVCINYRKDHKDEKWYCGALGEVMTMLDNSMYLTAASNLIGVDLDFNSNWFWSCSERSTDDAWRCGLCDGDVRCCWGYKYGTYRFVPFLAYKPKEQESFIKKKQIN